MRWPVAALSLLIVSWTLGCGNDNGSNPVGMGPAGGDTTMKATIGGTAWTSTKSLITVTGNAGAPRQGMLVITGFEVASGTAMSLTLSFITGPGTYPLGVNVDSNPGGVGQVSMAPDSWLTPLTGAAGTIVVTTRTANRIAGTFSFQADKTVGAGTIAVTDGSLDITLEGGLPALPTGVGSTLSASLGGSPWNAATIVAVSGSPGVLGISASTTEYSVTLTPKIAVAAGNTYGIPSQVSLTIIHTGTVDSWSAVTGPDVGSFTVTTFSDSRAAGTFSGTIPPQGATSPLTIADGTFDVHVD